MPLEHGMVLVPGAQGVLSIPGVSLWSWRRSMLAAAAVLTFSAAAQLARLSQHVVPGERKRVFHRGEPQL